MKKTIILILLATAVTASMTSCGSVDPGELAVQEHARSFSNVINSAPRRTIYNNP